MLPAIILLIGALPHRVLLYTQKETVKNIKPSHICARTESATHGVSALRIGSIKARLLDSLGTCQVFAVTTFELVVCRPRLR